MNFQKSHAVREWNTKHVEVHVNRLALDPMMHVLKYVLRDVSVRLVLFLMEIVVSDQSSAVARWMEFTTR